MLGAWSNIIANFLKIEPQLKLRFFYANFLLFTVFQNKIKKNL